MTAGSRYEDVYHVASLYYLQGKTLEAIANQLTISRSTVSRLLRRARDEGVVRVSLADREGSLSPMAIRLRDKFGIRVHLVTMRENIGHLARLDNVARVAGQLLTNAASDHQIIGAAWGATVTHVARHITPKRLVGTTVVQLNGGASQQDFGLSYVDEIMSAFENAFDAQVVFFPNPAFFDNARTKEMMWHERTVQNVIALRDRLDLAVFGVGGLRSKTPCRFYSGDYFESGDIDLLERQGVVGDVCTVLIREDGSYADIACNARATGPTPDELLRVPRRLCVAADPSRAAAVLGALRAGVATDLVIDDITARTVVRRMDE